MGIGGITESGLTNNNTLVVGSERKMIEVSRKVMVVTDSGKFGRAAMIPVAPLDVVDTIITDTGIADDFRGVLERHEIEVRAV